MAKFALQFKPTYVATLRCRAWCEWPESKTYQSIGYEDATLTTTDNPVYVSVGITTYTAWNRSETGPRKPLRDAGPGLFTVDMDDAYWIGDTLVTEAGTTSSTELVLRAPREGEIDINLYIAAKDPIMLDQLQEKRLEEFSSLICSSATVFLNLYLGEIAVPVHPVRLRKILRGGKTRAKEIVNIKVSTRNSVTSEKAQAAVNRFTKVRTNLSAKTARSLSVAASRYLASLTEADPIDRYCDLWESCEFSGFGIRGETRHKISKILSEHLSTMSRAFTASEIDAALGIYDLYDTRCEIVHRAVEHPTELETKHALLAEIARELLNYHFKLPYSNSPRIEQSLEAYQNRNGTNR